MKWLALLFLLVGCVRSVEPQPPCGFLVDSDGQRVSWQKRFPVILYLDRSVPVEAYPAMVRASGTWNEALGFTAIQISNSAPSTSGPGRDGYSVIYWLSQWNPERSTEQAMTTLTYSGNEALEADVSVNAYNFSFTFDESLVFSNVDLDSLMVHEFGHVLGLVHSESQDSVMFPSLGSGFTRRELGAIDISDLKCEYKE